MNRSTARRKGQSIRCSSFTPSGWVRLEAHLQSLVEYFTAHAELALAAVFLASLFESLAIIGSVVPGSTIVFIGGMLVGLKAVDPWLAGAASVIGAVLGDGLSYWLGHRYKQAIRGMWPIRDHPAVFARGEAYFAAHGGKSVFLGRFFGPTRAIVPLIAGMSAMPPIRFYVMNVLSAFAWAAAHLVPGALFGASLTLAGAVSARLVALVGLLVIGVWLIVVLIRIVVRLAWPRVRRLQERIVVHARRRPSRIGNLVLPLVDPERKESTSLIVAAMLLIGGAWLFLGVVEDVVTRDTLVQTDQSIYEGLQALRTDWVDDVMITISGLGSTYVIVPVIVVVGIWFAATRHLQTLAYWLAATTFAAMLVLVLKFGFGRVRPQSAYALVDPFSFPSGHAALSIVAYGFLAYLLAHGKPARQKLLVALPLVALPVLIAFSRLYLGAHWFSDVAASAGLGLAWIGLLCIAYIHHVHETPQRALPLLLVSIATVGIFGTAYAHQFHDRDVDHYAKPDMLRTLPLVAWKDGQWRTFPPARSEVRGQREEPFSLQWVATPGHVAEVLEAAQWKPPVAWGSNASLLWLVPNTPIDALPVLPKFHQGRAPGLTFVRPLDRANRLVIRLWHVADVDVSAALQPRQPLWVATVTAERARMEFGLVGTARTTADISTPLAAIEQAVRASGASVEAQTLGGIRVLLVW